MSPPPRALLPALLRALSGSISALAVLGPFLWIAWPAIAAGDRVLVAYAAIAVAFAGLANALVDPTSGNLRKGEDHASEAILFFGMAIGVLLAGADVGRWHATDHVPEVARLIALGALAIGYALRLATIRTNTFFSSMLVIQTERGHTVIDRGPYAIIRHPGYASLLLMLPATGVAIGSLLALAPLGAAALRVLMRTAKEDRFLHTNLAGYAAYAERVRFRLLPGLW